MTMLRHRPTASPPAVIVRLDSITGLQSARILAARGVPVIGIARDPHHFACRSRACKKVLVAETNSEELIHSLQQLGPALPQRAVLMPCCDMSVLMVSRHCQQLSPWYHVTLPEAHVVELLADKIGFHQYASALGLPVPPMFVLSTRFQAEQAAQQLSFPCLVKPSLKTKCWQQHTKAKVIRVYDADQLLAVYDRYRDWTEALIVQQWIPGPDANLYSFNGYFDNRSQALVTFIARKIRQWPPQLGISSLGQECRNDHVLNTALRLFSSVGYRGLAYLEMKQDARTGTYYLIEANVGRPTGRSAIAEGGGVELLYTTYCDAAGLPLPESRRQKYGDVKWIYWRQDIRSALHYWRKGQLSLGEWFRSVQGKKVCAVFSWRDPRPFWSDLKTALVYKRRSSARDEARGQPAARALLHRAARLACLPLAALVEQFDRGRPDRLAVLTYHRIAWPDRRPELDGMLISATPYAFQQQMRYLAERYRVLSMAELIEARRQRKSLPPRSVLITFDDAYCDFAEHAWPILKEYGLPVTLFVPTAIPDQAAPAYWWDRLHGALQRINGNGCVATPLGRLAVGSTGERRQTLKRLKFFLKSLPHQQAMEWMDQFCESYESQPIVSPILSWNALRQLAHEGVTLGAHSRTHPILTRLPAEVARQEIFGAREDLDREVGPAHAVFAYPSGMANRQVLELVERAGFELAFGTRDGINEFGRANPLALRRLHISQSITPAVLSVRMSTWDRPF